MAPMEPASRAPRTAGRSALPCPWGDRKSTRLNSSHLVISYAVFCLKKKKTSIMRGASDLYRPQRREHKTLGSPPETSKSFVGPVMSALGILKLLIATNYSLQEGKLTDSPHPMRVA